MAGANLFTIPAERGFAEALATQLLAEAEGCPDTLADMLVLLPTRRACRSVREAFLRASGGRALILPSLRPIGDVDEEEMWLTGAPAASDLIDLPPAIGEAKRLLLLTRLVTVKEGQEHVSPDQAVRLARELATFLDQVETEGLDFEGLKHLVHGTLATHWEETLEFLKILSEAWPAVLTENGEMDPADRRTVLLRAQAEAWRAAPPEGPVIAAGSTGTIPATAALLKVVAQLPAGRVVLPGLDRHLDEHAWAVVRQDETHPQHGMAKLLEILDATRADVLDWPMAHAKATDRHAARARVALLSDAMRPASETGAWHQLAKADPTAFDGVDWLEAPDDAAEARAIALALRAELEEPERTATLVTPDRTLARRVASELARWGIDIDDSAGTPLSETPKAVFLRLTADAIASGLAPVRLMALLKHPLCRLGLPAGKARAEARQIELRLLRGPKPASGLSGLRQALEIVRQDARGKAGINAEQLRAALSRLDRIDDFINRLERAIGPFAAIAASNAEHEPTAFLTAHIAAAEALARSEDEAGAQRLWRGEDGEALGETLAELIAVLSPETGLALPSMSIGDYPGFLEALLAQGTVRPRYGKHPRLAILGPLEARLQRADLLVLGGLNEGIWPPEPQADAWMSRPMRKKFGLPAPERRIGLSAHDFAQAMAAPRVLLTRAAKAGGEPTVPSRWLERLSVVAHQAGIRGFTTDQCQRALDLNAWQAALDAHQPVPPITPPAPTPKVEARPDFLSVTRIEAWRRDPYGLYARSILKLEKLEDLEADLTAADKGTIIHDALDRFLREHPAIDAATAYHALTRIGEESFGEERLANPAVRAFWWPRFERIARWFLEREAGRRAGIASIHSEISGTLALPRPGGGEFTLYARADRVDVTAEGGYAILDYKTGSPPRPTDIEDGYAPQLPLEAAIAMAGGFDGLPEPRPVTELAFWRLTGGAEAGEIKPIPPDKIQELAEAAREGLVRLIAAFDDPSMPYRAIPRPDKAPRFNDYEHLARIREWSVRDGSGWEDAG